MLYFVLVVEASSFDGFSLVEKVV
uniref:Uncharacterized protein LOC105112702 isoform X2 n=1 Tax=Rhizophora mucronata TaxID=61149 RepID=A0A2P2KWN2_RHIMU